MRQGGRHRSDGHYRDDGPPRLPRDAADSMYRFGSNRPPRNGFHYRPKKASERELLTRLPISEIPVLGSNTGNRFRDVENMTDSEEEEMSEDEEEGEFHSNKRRKLASIDTPIQTTAKWSNPDPYTALPPPDSTTKRVDFVKLIRKARIDAETPDTTAEQDDFISFDSLGIDTAEERAANMAPANAPSGPKADRPGRYDQSNLPVKPPTKANHYDSPTSSTYSASNRPTSPPARRLAPSSTALGKRKRTDDDDGSRLIGVGDRSFHADCRVLSKWKPISNVSKTPWLLPHSRTDSPMVALHKEIIDFYNWVKPQEYEDIIRQGVVKRLETQLRRYKSGCRLEAFGSYAAGLYLPIADMDLVCTVPDSPIDGMPISKSQMYKIGGFLDQQGIARRGSLLVIGKAKVPIIKFVDDLTGLKVDMCFNNSTGTRAIKTFKAWQKQFPALPIIVAVIKQFLMIRGLNDNSVGGLGGFAVICLVTSLLQHFPSTKTPNLGEILIEFFNLYGNLFDLENVSIRMDPPGYLQKDQYRPLRDEKPDRLVIVDPNRSDNNITGGSSQVQRIFDVFPSICEDLRDRLDEYDTRGRHQSSFSFLDVIVGGNFTAYYEQRNALFKVYSANYPNGR